MISYPGARLCKAAIDVFGMLSFAASCFVDQLAFDNRLAVIKTIK
jgi:hypothetical protein